MPTANYVSCGLSIYAAGGFPGDETHFAQLMAAEVPEISPVAQLYRPVRYRRILDRAAIFADAEVLARLDAAYDALGGESVVAPGCVVVRIARACIRDRGIAVLRGGEPCPLFETYRPADRDVLPLPGPCGAERTLPTTHAYLLLTSPGTFNWGHWLAEDLPRLQALPWIAADGRPLCVLMHGFVPAVDSRKLDLLRALLRDSVVTLRLLRPDTAYHVENLYFVSPVGGLPGPKHPEALADAAATAQVLVQRQEKGWWRPKRSHSKRLFVMRRPHRGRVPTGLEQLAADLQARNYRIVDPEGMSAVEQAVIFASAERVVGCMGAAMVNTLFCRPGTRLLYLAPETFVDPYFFDLAAARGHRYGVCYGTALDPLQPSHSNYTLDPGHFARALDWLEGGPEDGTA